MTAAQMIGVPHSGQRPHQCGLNPGDMTRRLIGSLPGFLLLHRNRDP